MKNFFESDYWIFLQHPLDKQKRRKIRAQIKHKKFKILAPEALVKLSKLFLSYHEQPIDVWLEFGTLLGAYRNNRLIEYDYDLDFGIKENFMTAEFIEYLAQAGFSLKHTFKIKSEDERLDGFISEYTFSYSDIVLIDFFIFKELNGKICSFAFDAEEGLTWDETLEKYSQCLRTIRRDFSLFQLSPFYFYDTNFYVPDNIETHLMEAYGADFMTPKKYSYSDRPREYEHLLDVSTLGYMKKLSHKG